MPYYVFGTALSLDADDITDVFHHAFFGLLRHDLVDGSVGAWGIPDHISTTAQADVPEPGILFAPSPFGVELFRWAHGMRGAGLQAFLDPDEEFQFQDAPFIPVGSRSVVDLREEHEGERRHGGP